MSVNNPAKLIGILAGMVIIGVLMALHVLETTAGTPLLTMLVGYLVGNGVAARKGDAVEPVLGRRQAPADTDAQ